MQLQGTETASLSDKNASPVLKLNMVRRMPHHNSCFFLLKEPVVDIQQMGLGGPFYQLLKLLHHTD